MQKMAKLKYLIIIFLMSIVWICLLQGKVHAGGTYLGYWWDGYTYTDKTTYITDKGWSKGSARGLGGVYCDQLDSGWSDEYYKQSGGGGSLSDAEAVGIALGTTENSSSSWGDKQGNYWMGMAGNGGSHGSAPTNISYSYLMRYVEAMNNPTVTIITPNNYIASSNKEISGISAKFDYEVGVRIKEIIAYDNNGSRVGISIKGISDVSTIQSGQEFTIMNSSDTAIKTIEVKVQGPKIYHGSKGTGYVSGDIYLKETKYVNWNYHSTSTDKDGNYSYWYTYSEKKIYAIQQQDQPFVGISTWEEEYRNENSAKINVITYFDLTVEKQDDETGESLSGAEFVLKGSRGYLYETGNGNKWVSSPEEATKISAGGTIRVYKEDTTSDSYELIETKPTEGYSSAMRLVSVSSSISGGSVDNKDSEDSEGTRVSFSTINEGNDEGTITLTNKLFKITIKKEDVDSGESIDGAEFLLENLTTGESYTGSTSRRRIDI